MPSKLGSVHRLEHKKWPQGAWFGCTTVSHDGQRFLVSLAPEQQSEHARWDTGLQLAVASEEVVPPGFELWRLFAFSSGLSKHDQANSSREVGL